MDVDVIHPEDEIYQHPPLNLLSFDPVIHCTELRRVGVARVIEELRQ
jgi:hypothetical protein